VRLWLFDVDNDNVNDDVDDDIDDDDDDDVDNGKMMIMTM